MVPDELMIGHVIEVCVREPEPDEIQFFLRDVIENRGDRVIGRVEENALAGGLVDDEKAICGDDAAGVRDEFHGSCDSARKCKRVQEDFV